MAAAGAASDFSAQAHKVRGACATVGGSALGALAMALEQSGTAGDMATVAARLPEVDAHVASLSEVLERMKDEG